MYRRPTTIPDALDTATDMSPTSALALRFVLTVSVVAVPLAFSAPSPVYTETVTVPG